MPTGCIIVPKHAAALLALTLLSACSTQFGGSSDRDAVPDVTLVSGSAGSSLSLTANSFCAEAQTLVANSRVVASNFVYDSYEEFVLSKPQVQPLFTRQYVVYGEDASGMYPKLISCKLKTADHINAEYGDGSAGPEQTCRRLLQVVLWQVYEAIPSYERRQIVFDQNIRVVVEDDLSMPTGEEWLKPFTPAWLDADGRLRLQAKALRVDWRDQRYAAAPARFRGNHYCRVAAPEYLYRIVTGRLEP